MPSKTTDALSAPVCWAITGTWLRSPQTCNCSTAAALKVSPAANITVLPCFFKRLANLPMVVVLPTPLTPTTSITKGLPQASKSISLSHTRNLLTNISCSANFNAAPSLSAWRLNCAVNSAIIAAVVSMPTSAINNAVSSSSSNAVSIALVPKKSAPSPSPVRDNAERMRSVKDTLVLFTGS